MLPLGPLLLCVLLAGGALAQCTIGTDYGCFKDSIGKRVFPFNPGAANSWTECAALCNSVGHLGTGGVEGGVNCYCSDNSGPQGTKAESDSSCSKPCEDEKSKTCGGTLYLNEFSFTCVGPPPPPSPSPPPPPGPGPSPSPSTYVCEKTSCISSDDPKGFKTKDECAKKCGKKSSSALSPGSITLIIFFCGLVIPYFAIGAVYMKVKQQKSGREMIPNVEFWSSLPGLIKDGVLFLWYKITGREATYSKI